jgi:glycosyltransferase 2 family protein
VTSRRGAAAWQWPLLGLGLALFAGLISAAGPTAILAVFRGLGPLTPLVALPYLATYVLDSLGWWWVLTRRFMPPGVPAPGPLLLFALRAGGEAINAITPTAYFGGEPVKAWLLARRGIPLSFGLASVLVSKTALMLTQGLFVFLGLLLALQRWQSAIPLPLAAAVGLLLAVLMAVLLIGAQRRGLFGLLLELSRRVSGREALLARWEPEVASLDALLREFYGARPGDFCGCLCLHFAGWVVGSLEVYAVLWLLGHPVDAPTAFAIEALAGVAKLAALVIPGSLGVQEGGQMLLFLAFGLGAPLAMSFSLLRRARELVWVAFGLSVLIHGQAMRWIRGEGPES